MKRYVIGVDGGGSTSKYTAMDLSGEILLSRQAASINVSGTSRDLVKSALKEILKTCEAELGVMPEYICIGTAGLTNPETAAVIKAALQENAYPLTKVIMRGDQEIALTGALNQDEGIILISGTGSICYAKDKRGNAYKVGGLGHIVDDFGSAYDIARQILIAIVQTEDGRIEPTLLKQLVFEQLHISTFEDLIAFIYQANLPKSEIAQLAVLLETAVDKGDQAALVIENRAVNSLFVLVETMVQKLTANTTNIDTEKIKLAYSGSVLENNWAIRTKLSSKIENSFKQLEIVEKQHAPVFGAATLALQHLYASEAKGFPCA